MKISFYGNFKEEPTEGRYKIVMRLASLLRQEGFDIIFNKKDVDIIHAHSSGIFLAKKISKIKKQTKLPCIYSLYSTCESRFKEYFRNYWEQWKYFQNGLSLKHFFLSASSIISLNQKSFVCKDLDCVIVPSESMKSKIRNNNVKVIHLGVDTDKFRGKINIKKPKNEIWVGYVGHENSSKGLTDYLMATKILDNLDSKIKFKAFITEIPDKLRRYAKLINEKVELYKNPKSMPRVYNSLDMVVLPYRMSLSATANPLVLLEAMSCGKSIITTNLQNIKEIAKNGAITINPYSPLLIAEQIYKLENDEKLRTLLGKRAREIIKKFYNEKKMVNEYIKVYDEL